MIQFGDVRLPDRFWSKVMPEPNSGCWLWIGACGSNGYGRFGGPGGRSGRTLLTHRHAYETLVGRVVAGLELDHLCRTRCCCNPRHLEPVTRAVNIQRSPIAVALKRRQATHCARGHEYATHGTTRRSGRRCKACRRLNESRQERAQ